MLDHLLGIDFPGRDALATQARTARVQQIDDNGSLRFQAEGTRATVISRVPVEGRYFDGGIRSGPAVNVLLHVVAGYLHELDAYKDDGSAIQIGPFAVPLAEITVSVN